MIIDEVKKNVTDYWGKSYIADIGLLVLQQQNNKGEADLTKKEREKFTLSSGDWKVQDQRLHWYTF